MYPRLLSWCSSATSCGTRPTTTPPNLGLAPGASLSPPIYSHNAPKPSFTTWCGSSTGANGLQRSPGGFSGRYLARFLPRRRTRSMLQQTYVEADALSGQTKQRERERPQQGARKRHASEAFEPKRTGKSPKIWIIHRFQQGISDRNSREKFP